MGYEGIEPQSDEDFEKINKRNIELLDFKDYMGNLSDKELEIIAYALYNTFNKLGTINPYATNERKNLSINLVYKINKYLKNIGYIKE